MKALLILAGAVLPGAGLLWTGARSAPELGVAAAEALPPTPAREPAHPHSDLLTRVHVEIPMQALEHYVWDADEIVRGVVLGQEAVFPARGLAYTEYELAVLSAVKGTELSTIDVRVGGAHTEHQVVDVVGAPRFQDGEEVVLFLMEFTDPFSGAEYWGVRGLGHGAYRLGQDRTGEATVHGLHAAREASLADFEGRLLELYARSGQPSGSQGEDR